jgi:predicted O-methyltransferase YrrM
MLNGSAVRWLKHSLGWQVAGTQVTAAEHACLERHATNRRSLVEIGVMHGVTTARLRRVMNDEGAVTGIDPHPPGRLGVSFERWIALREVSRHPRGRAVLLRCRSQEAAENWATPIDFLFIDGDHSWDGIDLDWRCWSGFVEPGGVIALHDSRTIVGRPDLDSVRYTREVILEDPRFREIEFVESVTVLERVGSVTNE